MSRNWKRHHFSRRRMLRGMFAGSAITVGLPWLETLVSPTKRAWASADGLFPKRFGIFYWGNGNRPERWTPIGEGTGYALSDELAPLAGLEDKLTVISGMSIKVPNTIPHWSGAAGFLAGAPAIGSDNDDWTMAGPSIDQVVAAEIGGSTLYRSLEVGVDSTASLSYNAPFSSNPCESDPFAFFERMFGSGFVAGGGEVPPSLGWRRSVLDSVMGDLAQLIPTLSQADQVRLDQHLTGVRELELRLALLQENPPDMAACTTPGTPDASYPTVDGRKPLSEISRAMSDLIAMSLACDQSRVFTQLYTRPLTNVLFPNADDGHHNLTHHEADEQPMVHEIAVQVMSDYAYLLNALEAIPEGDETLLDHCCVMATSDCSEGRTHALDEIPLVYAGSACGSLVTGTHYRSFTQENVGKAVLSIIRAMGVVAPSWGADDVYTTDGLSAIEV